MQDGSYYKSGWGLPAGVRIAWFFDTFPRCDEQQNFQTLSEQKEAEKTNSIWLNVHVSFDKYTLLDESYITGPPPNYFPGEYELTVKVFSAGGGLLYEYGLNDPRRIFAEDGYEGPTWLDETTFPLIVPYYKSCSRVDLIESATGIVKISIDISEYATADAECYDNSECPDDNLYCTGTPTCQQGVCSLDSDPCESDIITPVCDEVNDSCVECLEDSHCGPFFECVSTVCVPDCPLAIKYKAPISDKLKKDKKLKLTITGGEGFDPNGTVGVGSFSVLTKKVNIKKNSLQVTVLVPAWYPEGTYPVRVGDCFGKIEIL
jgi:hypothetical protein